MGQSIHCFQNDDGNCEMIVDNKSISQARPFNRNAAKTLDCSGFHDSSPEMQYQPAFHQIAENTLTRDNEVNLPKSLSDVNFSRYYSIENRSKKFCGFEKASKFVTANF